MRHVIAASIIAVLPSLAAFGQSIAGPPAFEVAAVKPNTNANDNIRGKARILAGGRKQPMPNIVIDHVERTPTEN
jgi:hypothetical protein